MTILNESRTRDFSIVSPKRTAFRVTTMKDGRQHNEDDSVSQYGKNINNIIYDFPSPPIINSFFFISFFQNDSFLFLANPQMLINISRRSS